MKLPLAITGMMLLSACDPVGLSGPILSGRTEVLCNLDLPTYTEAEVEGLSDETLRQIETFILEREVVCNG